MCKDEKCEDIIKTWARWSSRERDYVEAALYGSLVEGKATKIQIFFHEKATQKKKKKSRNRVEKKFKDDNNLWKNDLGDIKAFVSSYFVENLFGGDISDIKTVWNILKCKINAEAINILSKTFIEKKIFWSFTQYAFSKDTGPWR